ncbi:protein kinase [Trypanosoma cruzi Dm28c]|uniref:Protein kinase n=2 Tax=Trypanosoma cruzi TaxID=5693 RepID=V5DIC3_TRYCR|nr:protein kinase [Trypanosoma cruzi Dm28c]
MESRVVNVCFSFLSLCVWWPVGKRETTPLLKYCFVPSLRVVAEGGARNWIKNLTREGERKETRNKDKNKDRVRNRLTKMPPVLSPEDHAKAKEFSAFLRHLGLSHCLNLFVEQWQLLVKQQDSAKSQGGKKGQKVSRSSASSRSRKSSSCAVSNFQILQTMHRVVTSTGVEEELWKLSGEDYLSPEFAGGAGITLEKYKELQPTEETRLVPTKPYFKEAAPSNLPLDSFHLRVVYEVGKTGFEDEKDFPILADTVVAGRYQMLQFLDSAAFSRAVRCMDLIEDREVCLKIIRNSKDFFDQSLDEIKLLKLIDSSGSAEENCVVKLYDYFYYKEHMFIVTELLRDNLYQFSKFNREEETEFYFTLPRLQAIAKQILTGLCFLQNLGILHCDLKPENILIHSFSRCEVKIIDFGSSCYLTDNLSSYVQSRCYRAPEVILGCKYDGRVDIWSLGAILAELATGRVLFENTSLQQMLASICSVCGPLPASLLHEGRNTQHFVTKTGVFYEYREGKELVFHFPVPQNSLEAIFGYDDPLYIDFVRACLTIDHHQRPTAAELLQHPFLQEDYGSACSSPPPLKKKLLDNDEPPVVSVTAEVEFQDAQPTA